jgi:hypothetical protein
VSKVGVAIANVDHGGGRLTADLDTLLIALYVLADEVLPRRPRARRRPRITDAELVCLAVAQILLDIPSERHFLRFAMTRLGHLFPYLPKQPGYNKRMRALAPQIVRLLNVVAFASPSWHDKIRLLDSTPVPCGASRETVKRSAFAGHACGVRKTRSRVEEGQICSRIAFTHPTVLRPSLRLFDSALNRHYGPPSNSGASSRVEPVGCQDSVLAARNQRLAGRTLIWHPTRPVAL